VRLDQLFGDRQSEPETAVRAAVRAVGLAESIEGITEKLGLDSCSGVADGDLDRVLTMRQAGFNAAAFLGELDCV